MTLARRTSRHLAGLFLGLAALTGAAYGGAAYRAAITSRITAGIVASESSVKALGQATFPAALNYSASLISGTGAGAADVLWSDTLSIPASHSINIDLVGSKTTAFGGTFSPAKIKAVMITATAANTTDLRFGAATSNGWVGFFSDVTDAIVLKPGYVFLLGGTGTGYTATAGTVDVFKVKNLGATLAKFAIVVLGTST
jgi:hypothetical protein